MFRTRQIAIWMTIYLLVVPSIVHAQESELLARLLRQLSSPVPTQKVQAAGQLAKLGTAASSATELLIVCLEDADPDVRLYSAFALAEVATDMPRTLKSLVPVLADKNEHVRYSAEWSIAKLARSLEAEPADDAPPAIDESQLAPVVAALEATLARLAKQEHQPRHAQAIKSALETLHAAGALGEANPQGKATRSAAADAALADAIAELERQFAIGDRVQCLQLIEEVRVRYLKQPEVVSRAMHSVLLADDRYLLQFAVSRWGAAAEAAMKQILVGLDDNQLPAWGVSLLANIVPTDRQLFERMLGLALNRRMTIDVRITALEALGKAKVDRPRAQAALMATLVDRAELDELRLASALALANLGELPTNMHPPLLAILGLTDDLQALRTAIECDLHKFAPSSKEAVQVLANRMLALPVHDAQCGDLANAIRQFGMLGAVAFKPLTAGLSSSEESNRVACAQALGELGEVAIPATGALVSIITDPQISIRTKSEVAKVLRKLGPRSAAVLSERMTNQDPVVREHVLRALAIIGPAAQSAVDPCVERMQDPREETCVRAAAAAALGAFGPASVTAVPALEAATSDKEERSLRIAALLALARVQPSIAMPRAAAFATESSRELRISAAFAKHLAGMTVESFHDLMELTEYSNNRLIEDTLLDLGSVVMPMLLDTIRDPQATDEQRVTCMRAASQMHPSDWSPMLESLANERLGQEFYEAILFGWDFDDNLLPQLLVALRNEQTPTGAKARMLQLAEYITSDLGAAGDYETWSESFAVSRHVEDSQGSERAMMAAPENSFAAEQAPPAPTTALPPEDSLLIPEMQNAHPTSPLASVDDRLVRVFYGTNRQPLNVELQKQTAKTKSSSGYAAAMGFAIAAMATCCFGFLRRRSPRYTFAAIAGLAAISTLAMQTTRFTDSSLEEVENVEYGTLLSSTVEMGVCEVTIPESHRPGELESPSLLLRLEVTEDPTKHIVLKSVHRLEPERFFADIHAELEQKGSNILVFVHGYNVSFEDAARRTAQMAYDLKFPGAPVFYSWPSQANWYGYRNDSENIKNSVDQIKGFLTDLATKSNATSINLVAHSMGNVGLTSALARMPDNAKFNQIVLAAPDIDAETFKNEIAPKIISKGKRVTLYTSKTDLALIASKYFNRGPRAGDSGSELVLVPGMQTIDATSVDSSLLGHSYYGSNVNVLYDLGQLLNGQPIEARDYLRPNSDLKRPYWYFVPPRMATRSSIPSIPLRR